MLDRDYDFIRHLVYTHSRINLGPDKKELVASRLGKRLRAVNLTSISDYCSLLRKNSGGEELARLIDVISTNHTYFFRESAHFDYLVQTALPELVKKHPAAAGPLNFWSAACSSGEEPYTLALVLAQFFGADSHKPAWRIEATDISHRVLEQARNGIYRAEALAKVPKTSLRAHFQEGFGPQAGCHRVKASLQERITFRQLNLLGDTLPFPVPFHVIFCRNVMIYFDRATQEELVRKLAGRLVPGGYLMVGHSESLTGLRHSLQVVRPAIYRRAP